MQGLKKFEVNKKKYIKFKLHNNNKTCLLSEEQKNIYNKISSTPSIYSGAT